MGLLTGAAILAAADIQTEDVPCPEWGGSVRVRGLSLAERDLYEDWLKTRRDDKGDLRSSQGVIGKLVAMAAIGEDGNPLFTESQQAELQKKSAAPLGRLFDVAKRLSGLSAEDVKGLEKNSEATAS